jgi:hypothetical protein
MRRPRPRASTLDRAELRQLLRPVKDRLVRRWLERLLAGGGAKNGGPAEPYPRGRSCIGS